MGYAQMGTWMDKNWWLPLRESLVSLSHQQEEAWQAPGLLLRCPETYPAIISSRSAAAAKFTTLDGRNPFRTT